MINEQLKIVNPQINELAERALEINELHQYYDKCTEELMNNIDPENNKYKMDIAILDFNSNNLPLNNKNKINNELQNECNQKLIEENDINILGKINELTNINT